MLRRLHWRIALLYVALILIATLGSTVYISTQVRQVRLADLESQLLGDARVLASSAAALLRDGADANTLDELARIWAVAFAGRVTIIGTDGTTLGESHKDREEMGNHLARPEVQQALQAGEGSSVRLSTTLGYEMMYAAVPIRTAGGSVLGVMRVALPMEEIETHLSSLRRNVLLAGLAAALLAALLAVPLAERATEPVRQLIQLTERLEKGDPSVVFVPVTGDEVGQLAEGIAHLAGQFRGQMSKLTAALDYVADGVLITDGNGQLALINAAAARMLGITQKRAPGRSFTAVAPFRPLIQLWTAYREKGKEQVEVLELGQQGLVLQAIVTPLPEGEGDGCLVILHDLTRIRALEMAQPDLIRSISQKLRLPLTGLRVVVDSLRGRAEDPSLPEALLNRMDAEMDALTQMMDELLELSRIDSGQAPLHLAPTPVAEVVLPPVDRLIPQARLAGLELTVLVPPEIPQVLADVDRARLALGNLVHNAIKFTPAGGSISVVAQPTGDSILFTVQDSGVGIPAAELPGVFRWTYRVAGAQSGGIGPGLAIAKQIVQGHGGRIWAESIENQGSTFSFTLPVAVMDDPGEGQGLKHSVEIPYRQDTAE
jgi:two-component system phosphate regulon sensor histidine kinase PhoR